jgi:hypothetical protein
MAEVVKAKQPEGKSVCACLPARQAFLASLSLNQTIPLQRPQL